MEVRKQVVQKEIVDIIGLDVQEAAMLRYAMRDYASKPIELTGPEFQLAAQRLREKLEKVLYGE